MPLSRRLIREGLFSDVVVGVEVPARSTEIRRCREKVARRIISAHHYSGGMRIMAMDTLTVHYKGLVSGAISLSWGQNPRQAREEKAIEFDRLWLSDEMPKFSESVVIGALHTYLRVVHPSVERIRSWSDVGEGNPGTIYKAANYRYVRSVTGHFYRHRETGEKTHGTTIWTPGRHLDKSPHRLFEESCPGRNNPQWLEANGWEAMETEQRLYEFDLWAGKKRRRRLRRLST